MAGYFDDVPVQGSYFDDVPAVTTQFAPESFPIPEAAMSEDFTRQLQLTGRAGLQGVGDVADFLATPFRTALNLLPGVDIQGRTGEALADVIGLPKPQNQTERLAGAATEAMAGGALPIGLGAKIGQSSLGTVRQNLGKILAENPQFQTVLNFFAGLGGQAAEESGAGTGGQLAASMAAPMAAVALAKPTAWAGRRTAEIVSPMVSERGAQRAAGRVVADASKDRAAAVAHQLQQGDPMLTAGQAGAKAGSAEMAGLEKLIGSRAPSEYGVHGTIPTAQQTALDDMWARLNTQTGPAREAALTGANAQATLNVAPLSMDIAAMRADPNLSNTTAQKMLQWVDRELVRIADQGTGDVNARALYNLRKDLGLKLKQWQSKADWDKQTASGLMGDIQKRIDLEIDNALGNTQWSDDYLTPFAQEARRISSLRDLIPQAEQMGAAGMPEARRITNINEAPVHLPNLLERSVMLINALLRSGQGYGGEKTTQQLVQLMRPENKAKLGDLLTQELMRRESRVPLGQAFRYAGRAGMYDQAFDE